MADDLLSVKTVIEYKEARQVLLNHGCTIDGNGPECTVIFPEGTTRAEIYPRTYQTRFRLVLPDGAELREVDVREDRNYLQIVLDSLPSEEQEHLKRQGVSC